MPGDRLDVCFGELLFQIFCPFFDRMLFTVVEREEFFVYFRH